MRNSYWNYIEIMIFDLDINEPDQQMFNKQPKNVYSYIKSQKKENTSIAPPRSEGVLHADPTEKANTSNHEKHLDFQKRHTETHQQHQPQKSCRSRQHRW